MTVEDIKKRLAIASGNIITAAIWDWQETRSYTEEAVRRVHEVEIEELIKGHRPGSGRIRSSMIGDPCHRKHVLSMLGYEQETQGDGLMEIMGHGTMVHREYQKRLLSVGALVDIERWVSLEGYPMVVGGAVDGVIHDGSVLEIKTAGPRVWQDIMAANAPKYEHILQAHLYMMCMGVDKASILYDQRSYKVEFREFRINREDQYELPLLMMLNTIAESVTDKQLPVVQPGCEERSGKQYESCWFKDSCAVASWR